MMEVNILMTDDHTIHVADMDAEDIMNLVDDFKTLECTVLTVCLDDSSVIHINKDHIITIETSESVPNNND